MRRRDTVESFRTLADMSQTVNPEVITGLIYNELQQEVFTAFSD